MPLTDVNEEQRFELLGVVPEERDDNSGLAPENQEQYKRPDNERVGFAATREEAESVRLAGGFVGPDNNWVVVTGYRDLEAGESSGSGTRAISKHDVDQG